MVDISKIPENLRLIVLLSGLIGVVTWNIITRSLILTSCSWHPIVGGSAVAALAFFVANFGLAGVSRVHYRRRYG